jgi:hypothetical protein
MSRHCRECKRINPEEASYCYYDGFALGNGARAGASVDFGVSAFPMPFVFPSGQKCQNFLQLATACRQRPQEATEVLQQGFLEGFFGSVGRIDLAMAARSAAKEPDRDRGLDDLLGKLPGSPLQGAKLNVEPEEKRLGTLQVGEDRQFELKITNGGDRLLHGKVSVEGCPWLALGDSGTTEKLFQCFEKITIRVHVRGKCLRAFGMPQKAEISVESNGGNVTVPVSVMVPVKAFPDGILAGATSPRALASLAKPQPKEAAVYLENGAVARWYEANGWEYPVKGPCATGIAAVQQFFETLGLVKPPKVELKESAISLRGKPGEQIEHVVVAQTQEKRAAVAHAVSDQPWVTFGKTSFRGQTASIPVIVTVPYEPHRTVTAHVKVTANGNQRFDVPLTLQIGDGPSRGPVGPSTPTPTPAAEDIPVLSLAVGAADTMPEPLAVSPLSLPPGSWAVASELDVPVLTPEIVPTLVEPEQVVARSTRRRERLVRFLPLLIVLLGLLTAVGRDIFFRQAGTQGLPEVDPDPRLILQFHETPVPGDFVPTRSLSFGLGFPDEKDKKKIKKRLIFDEFGRTCNVCVRVEKTGDYLWGVEQGKWQDKSEWVRTAPPPIAIRQSVEIVPGGLTADGKKRALDTCVVRYDITNADEFTHRIGLRFMLDTCIGSRDGMPFTIAGEKQLCNSVKEFKSLRRCRISWRRWRGRI